MRTRFVLSAVALLLHTQGGLAVVGEAGACAKENSDQEPGDDVSMLSHQAHVKTREAVLASGTGANANLQLDSSNVYSNPFNTMENIITNGDVEYETTLGPIYPFNVFNESYKHGERWMGPVDELPFCAECPKCGKLYKLLRRGFRRMLVPSIGVGVPKVRTSLFHPDATYELKSRGATRANCHGGVGPIERFFDKLRLQASGLRGGVLKLRITDILVDSCGFGASVFLFCDACISRDGAYYPQEYVWNLAFTKEDTPRIASVREILDTELLINNGPLSTASSKTLIVPRGQEIARLDPTKRLGYNLRHCLYRNNETGQIRTPGGLPASIYDPELYDSALVAKLNANAAAAAQDAAPEQDAHPEVPETVPEPPPGQQQQQPADWDPFYPTKNLVKPGPVAYETSLGTFHPFLVFNASVDHGPAWLGPVDDMPSCYSSDAQARRAKLYRVLQDGLRLMNVPNTGAGFSKVVGPFLAPNMTWEFVSRGNTRIACYGGIGPGSKPMTFSSGFFPPPGGFDLLIFRVVDIYVNSCGTRGAAHTFCDGCRGSDGSNYQQEYVWELTMTDEDPPRVASLRDHPDSELVPDSGPTSATNAGSLRVAAGMEDALENPGSSFGYDREFCLLKDAAGNVVRLPGGSGMSYYDPEFIQEGSKEVIEEVLRKAAAAAEESRQMMSDRYSA